MVKLGDVILDHNEIIGVPAGTISEEWWRCKPALCGFKRKQGKELETVRLEKASEEFSIKDRGGLG